MSVHARVAVSRVTIPATVSDTGVVAHATPSVKIEIRGDPYEGAYEFTPADEIQIVPVTNKLMLQDLRINAIPSNYGKVSWDGSVLTIT